MLSLDIAIDSGLAYGGARQMPSCEYSATRCLAADAALARAYEAASQSLTTTIDFFCFLLVSPQIG